MISKAKDNAPEVCHRLVCDERCAFPACMGPEAEERTLKQIDRETDAAATANILADTKIGAAQ